jgi:hypothetical protein
MAFVDNIFWCDGVDGMEYDVAPDNQYLVNITPGFTRKAYFRGSTSGRTYIQAAAAAGANFIISLPALAANASMAVTGEVEVDFGSAAVSEKAFTAVAAANVNAASTITAVQSGKAATGRTADENEFAAIVFRAVPKAGSFDLYATSLGGRDLQGKFKVSYTIGG